MKTDYKRWFRNCIISLAGILFGIFILVLIVDPFFHYHAPIMKYRLIEPRYSNDGIGRHFDFDAVITGTSMVQNFKTSAFDETFGAHSVKMSFSGAGYEEISDNLGRTLSRNPNVSKVLWAVDYNGLLRKPDWSQYKDYPTYLYDNNPLNDAPYIYNKTMLYHALIPDLLMTVRGEDSTTMDDYVRFDAPSGAAAFYRGRHIYSPVSSNCLTESEKDMVRETFQTNLLDIIDEYPNTTFYLYFTPYSIYNWEYLKGCNQIERHIEAQTIATEMLLKCPNVKLYTFFENTDMICDLDNYTDEAHYVPAINEFIIDEMAQERYLVTTDNYLDRIAAQREFFLNFDYDSYFNNLEQEIGYQSENSN